MSEENHKKQFTGWWIPVEVVELFEAQTINAAELVLLATIDSLTKDSQPCFASNAYLGDLIHLCDLQIMAVIGHLVEVGILKKRTRDGRRELITTWRLRCKKLHPKGDKNITGGVQKISLPSPPKRPELIYKSNKQDTERERSGLGVTDDFFKKCIHKLHGTILRECNINKDTKTWSKVFQQLQRFEGVSKERIWKALVWYDHHFGELYIPRVEDARGFRNAFARIESRMKEEQPAKPKVELSDHAEVVVGKLTGGEYHWPAGSRSLLPECVQRSLDNYNAWQEKRAALKVTLEREAKEGGTTLIRGRARNLLQLHTHLDEAVFTGPKAFVTRWFGIVNKRVVKWADWNGNLSYFVISPTQPDFLKFTATEAESYGGNELWMRYSQRLNEN